MKTKYLLKYYNSNSNFIKIAEINQVEKSIKQRKGINITIVIKKEINNFINIRVYKYIKEKVLNENLQELFQEDFKGFTNQIFLYLI